MNFLKSILRISLILAAIVLGVGILASLIICGAYGLGLLLNLFLHWQPFEATLISLIALGLILLAAVQVFTSVTIPLRNLQNTDLDDDDDEWDDDAEWDGWEDEDDDEDKEDDEDEKTQSVVYPGVPRWRQPLKTVDFTNAKPDDRCPCGSGRKYKNCHGAKTATR